MTTITSMQRDIHDLKQALIPKPPASFVVCYPWEPTQPHGRYGYQRVISTRPLTFEAVDEATELASMQAHYDGIPKFAKRLHNGPGEGGEDWRTFDSFRTTHECHCGRFGHT